jgi:hypothetical protein
MLTDALRQFRVISIGFCAHRRTLPILVTKFSNCQGNGFVAGVF